MTTDEVRERIEAMWPDPRERDRVATLLAEYGRESYEGEGTRVHLAILKLSEGRAEKIADLVAAAKRDFRDVLMWAEYPEEGRALWALTPNLPPEGEDELARIRQRDREQYLDWLRKK